MDDFSWVAPTTKNLANIFGLNPEVAAKGRNMQADYDLTVAKTKNTDADTGLSPFRRDLLTAQTGTQVELAGKHKADAGKTAAETEGLGISNRARTGLANLIASGGAGYAEDGSLVIKPDVVNAAGGFLAAMDADPVKAMSAFRGLAGNAGKTPRARAQARGIAAVFEPDAATTAAEGKEITAAKAAAAKDEAVAVQTERNRGSLAESIAKGGAAAGQPDQQELNRQMEAIKQGAEWAMKVPIGPGGGFLNEEQAFGLAQAARAANPNLNVPDAIRKFVQDNPGMLKSNWEMFGNNKVDIPGGIPSVVPRAPAAAPAPAAPVARAVAPTSTPNDSWKGAPSERMTSVPGQPAPAAPAAQSGTMTKEKFAAMPEGGSVVLNGVKYVKQGRQLVKAQ